MKIIFFHTFFLIYFHLVSSLCSRLFLSSEPDRVFIKGYETQSRQSTKEHNIQNGLDYTLTLKPSKPVIEEDNIPQIELLYNFEKYDCSKIQFEIQYQPTAGYIYYLESPLVYEIQEKEEQLTRRIVVLVDNQEYYEYFLSSDNEADQQMKQVISIDFRLNQKKKILLLLQNVNTDQQKWSEKNNSQIINIGPIHCVKQEEISDVCGIRKYMDTKEEICKECSDRNCLTCSNQSTCNLCINGFELNENNQCFPSNQVSEEAVEEEVPRQNSLVGFFLENKFKASNGCLLIKGICVTCVGEFFATIQNKESLIKCKSFHHPKKDGKMQVELHSLSSISDMLNIPSVQNAGVVNVQTNKTIYQKAAQDCSTQNKILILKNNVAQCVQSCPQDNHHYYHPQENMCITCVEGCKKCTFHGCEKCNDNFVLRFNQISSMNECISLVTKMIETESMNQPGQNKCNLNNCEVCGVNPDSTIGCRRCNDGFYLHSNRCISDRECLKQGLSLSYTKSNQFCLDCSLLNLRISDEFCISSYQDKYLQLNLDNQVILQDCSQCTNLFECIECTLNKGESLSLLDPCLFLDTSGFCIGPSRNKQIFHMCQFNEKNPIFDSFSQKCISVDEKNCLSFNSYENKCINCQQGYFLDSQTNQCNKCHKSCSECTNKDQICENYLSKSRILQTACTITNCTACSTTILCSQCASEYYVDQTGSCTICPGKNCSTCNPTTPSLCTTCTSGYYLTSSGTCSACPSNCSACQSSNPTVCTACNSYYYLSPFQGTCNLCEDGYYNSNNSTSPSTVMCSSCDSTCQTCSGANNTDCTSCQSSLTKSLLTNLCVNSATIQSEINSYNLVRSNNCEWADSTTCLNDLEFSQNLSDANQKLSLAATILGTIGGFGISQISTATWFYLQNEQLIGNSYLFNSFNKLSMQNLHLKNDFAFNFFVLFNNVYTNNTESTTTSINYYQVEILGGQSSSRMLLFSNVESFQPYYIQNCFYQFIVVTASCILIAIFYIISSWHSCLDRIYQYLKWNLLIRSFMLCSNYILISAVAYLKYEISQASSGQSINHKRDITSLVLVSITLLIYLFAFVKVFLFLGNYRQRYDTQTRALFISLCQDLKESSIIYQLFWVIYEFKKIAYVFLFIFLGTSKLQVLLWIYCAFEFAFLFYICVIRMFVLKGMNLYMALVQFMQFILSLSLALIQTLSTNNKATLILSKTFIITTTVLHCAMIFFSITSPAVVLIRKLKEKKRESILTSCNQTQIISQQMSENIEDILNQYSLTRVKKKQLYFSNSYS